MAAEHIEVIQRQMKITFDKRYKNRALQPDMMVMIQSAKKLDFPSKFDAVWLGPYLVQEAFPNNKWLETLNGENFPTRTSGSRCKRYKARRQLACRARNFGSQFQMVANYMSLKWGLTYVLMLSKV